MVNSNKMHVVYGDGVLGLHYLDFDYLFSYERGSLESLKLHGKEWLYRPIYPTYWRATTSNDVGNGFSYHSAQWMGADMFPRCSDIGLTVDGHRFSSLPTAPDNNQLAANAEASNVQISFTYQTATVPQTTSQVTYQVAANGQMTISAHFNGQVGLPELPVFGLRMIIPTTATSFDYQGLSGETYPDRMAGGQDGHYHVDGMPLTPYLVPQEMGMHMQTTALKVTRETTLNNADHDQQPFTLSLKQGSAPFNFSLLPYTAEELESATHDEELPLARRAVLVIAGAVRGVGGIDSWGSPVDAQYQLPADRNYDFDVVLNPNE